MNGSINVESVIGKGSVFTIEIPYTPVSSPFEAADNKDRKPYKLAAGQSWSVLVVDDVEGNREVMASLFKEAGFMVYKASNGNEAVLSFKEHDPDLVIMDIILPDFNGIEANQKIQELAGEKGQSVIAVTASGFEYTPDEMLQKGFDAFITKPFRADMLFEEIRKILPVEYRFGSGELISEGEDGTSPASARAPEIARQIQTLPQHQYEELLTAIELLDLDQIGQIVNELEEDKPVKKMLRDILNQSDFRLLLEVDEILNNTST